MTTGLLGPEHDLLGLVESLLTPVGYCFLDLYLQWSLFFLFACIDVALASLAMGRAGILTGWELGQLSTHWPLCTKPLSPLATHSYHRGLRQPCLHWLPCPQAPSLLVAARGSVSVDSGSNEGRGKLGHFHATPPAVTACAPPQPALGRGSAGGS